uniref:Uncharacterized protein n=1 Tax=Arundo donax TaxID=35708 RepID=A0A0A9AJ51_ARUDO
MMIESVAELGSILEPIISCSNPSTSDWWPF